MPLPLFTDPLKAGQRNFISQLSIDFLLPQCSVLGSPFHCQTQCVSSVWCKSNPGQEIAICTSATTSRSSTILCSNPISLSSSKLAPTGLHVLTSGETSWRCLCIQDCKRCKTKQHHPTKATNNPGLYW